MTSQIKRNASTMAKLYDTVDSLADAPGVLGQALKIAIAAIPADAPKLATIHSQRDGVKNGLDGVRDDLRRTRAQLTSYTQAADRTEKALKVVSWAGAAAGDWNAFNLRHAKVDLTLIERKWAEAIANHRYAIAKHYDARKATASKLKKARVDRAQREKARKAKARRVGRLKWVGKRIPLVGLVVVAPEVISRARQAGSAVADGEYAEAVYHTASGATTAISGAGGLVVNLAAWKVQKDLDHAYDQYNKGKRAYQEGDYAGVAKHTASAYAGYFPSTIASQIAKNVTKSSTASAQKTPSTKAQDAAAAPRTVHAIAVPWSDYTAAGAAAAHTQPTATSGRH